MSYKYDGNTIPFNTTFKVDTSDKAYNGKFMINGVDIATLYTLNTSKVSQFKGNFDGFFYKDDNNLINLNSIFPTVKPYPLITTSAGASVTPTIIGDYYLYTIATDCKLTYICEMDTSIYILLAGGGGGGGAYSGYSEGSGGGGAGAFVTSTFDVTAQSDLVVDVTIGYGGGKGGQTYASGAPGGKSTIDFKNGTSSVAKITAGGGAGGGSAWNVYGDKPTYGDYGSSGGACDVENLGRATHAAGTGNTVTDTTSYDLNTTVSSQNKGGLANWGGGGGGGAGAVGNNYHGYRNESGGNGGAGKKWDYDGITYCAGGGGGNANFGNNNVPGVGGNGYDNAGSGGNGYGRGRQTHDNGKAGICKIAIPKN